MRRASPRTAITSEFHYEIREERGMLAVSGEDVIQLHDKERGRIGYRANRNDCAFIDTNSERQPLLATLKEHGTEVESHLTGCWRPTWPSSSWRKWWSRRGPKV